MKMNYTIKPTLTQTQYWVSMFAAAIVGIGVLSMTNGGMLVALAIGVMSGLFVSMNESLIRIGIEWFNGLVAEKVLLRPAPITMVVSHRDETLTWSARQKGVEIGGGVLTGEDAYSTLEQVLELYQDRVNND
jgi:hypothetical protein